MSGPHAPGPVQAPARHRGGEPGPPDMAAESAGQTEPEASAAAGV